MAHPMYGQNKSDDALDKIASSPLVEEAVTQSLTLSDSGKTFVVGAGSAAAFTLPAADRKHLGCRYLFVWSAAETDAITIASADATDTTGDLFVGGLLSCNAAAVNTVAQAVTGSNLSLMTLDDNVANTGGGPGTWVEVICIDVARWFVRGIVEGDSDADGVGSAIFSNA
jgi:hypothetical protein